MSTEQQDWLDDNRVRDTNGPQDEQPETTQDIATEAKDAFAPEHFNEVTLIMLMRVYDLQLALLSALDPEKAQAIAVMHERGQSFCPPPAFAEYDDTE